MARRKNFEARSKKRQLAPGLMRRESHLNKRLLVILACEGRKTEKLYFEAWFAALKNYIALSSASCVVAAHQHTNPTGVLEDLLRFKDYAGRTYKDYEHRWIIFDRDEERHSGGGHTLEDFNKAIAKARKNRPEIKVGWSNPCFELWYLLHFHFHNTAIDRDQVILKLKQAMKEAYDKSRTDMFSLLESHLPKAFKNARQLIEEARTASGKLIPANANPATNVYELVELLQSLQQRAE